MSKPAVNAMVFKDEKGYLCAVRVDFCDEAKAAEIANELILQNSARFLEFKEVLNTTICDIVNNILPISTENGAPNVFTVAFKNTSLSYERVSKETIHVLGAVEGQGFRRTAMAEAFSDELTKLGYVSYVYYQMD